jgi:hypothetical protein
VRAIRLGLLIGLIVTMSAACAELDAPLPLSMTATTLTAGWERHFSFEWAAAEQGQGARKVAGYVYNNHGEYAITLRVLAQAVDAGGAVVGQRIAYVPGGVGGFGRAYFEVRNLPATPSYRLSVWDYTWFQADGDGKM